MKIKLITTTTLDIDGKIISAIRNHISFKCPETAD
jgi:hypothetical protein